MPCHAVPCHKTGDCRHLVVSCQFPSGQNPHVHKTQARRLKRTQQSPSEPAKCSTPSAPARAPGRTEHHGRKGPAGDRPSPAGCPVRGPARRPGWASAGTRTIGRMPAQQKGQRPMSWSQGGGTGRATRLPPQPSTPREDSAHRRSGGAAAARPACRSPCAEAVRRASGVGRQGPGG